MKRCWRDVRPLANIAVVEVAQHRLALNVDAGVSELQITFFLQATNSSFSPISAPVMRVAGGIDRLLISSSRGVCRGRNDVRKVAASLGILNVVADERDRESRMSSIDIEASDGVEQPELRGELCVR